MKKNYTLFIGLLLVVAASSCSSILDKKINIDDYKEIASDYREVASLLDKTDTLPFMKRKYIKDNLHSYVEFAFISDQLNKTMGEGMGKTDMIGEVPTFRQQIETFAAKYEAKLQEVNQARENNRKLRTLFTLEDATPYSASKNKGYIDLNFKVDNPYGKEIAYAVVDYKYATNQNEEQFYSRVRITDKVAKDFKGEVELRTVELYNEAAKFLHSKLPNDKKEAKETLMKGLVVEPQTIVFKDNSHVMLQDTLWDYYEARVSI